MPAVGVVAPESHTNVCEESRISSDFVALFRYELKLRNVTVKALADQLGWQRMRLCRIFKDPAAARMRDLVAICSALELSWPRATFAIDTMRDWQAYYDAALHNAVILLPLTVNKINESGTRELEVLTATAAESLSEALANILAVNQEQICTRRETMVKLKCL